MTFYLKLATTAIALTLLATTPACAQEKPKAETRALAQTEIRIQTLDAQTEKSIDLAESFYRDVLIYRNLNNFGKYIGETYKQHATAYADGPAEMLAAVAKELTANPDVEIDLYRTIAEGPYVGIHSVWTTSDGAKYVYVDIWRVEGDLLVEHWDHYQTAPNNAANTNTMYLGTGANIYAAGQDTDRNRDTAIAVLKAYENPQAAQALSRNIAAQDFVQHDPALGEGRENWVKAMSEMAAANVQYDVKIAKTIAMGDMVLVHSKRTARGNDADMGMGYMNIFRFDSSGKIAEHWSVEEKQTGESANQNDVFGYPSD